MPPSFIRCLLASASPAGRRARLSILIFHRILARPDPLFPGETDVRRFDEICSWLRDWFNVLPLAEAVERLRHASLPARAACLTFDDGYADNCTHALPVLQRHGLHATFFVATGFLDGGRMWNDTLIEALRATPHDAIDLTGLGLAQTPVRSVDDKRKALAELIPALKHLQPEARKEAVAAVESLCGAPLPRDLMLTSAQLRALHSAGMGIGAHTVSHPILVRCDEAAAKQEIAESRERLDALLGERIGLFAYPNGRLGTDYTPEHAEMVKELGFDAAVSTNPGASRYGDDVFQLCRFTPWDRRRWRFALRLARNLTVRRPASPQSRKQ